jgi:hypothetical protein
MMSGGREGGRVGSKSAFLAFGRQLCCRPKAKSQGLESESFNESFTDTLKRVSKMIKTAKNRSKFVIQLKSVSTFKE